MTFQPLVLVALLLAQTPTPVGRGIIAGRILQEDGTPAAGVRVAAVASNNAKPDAVAILGLTESDADGRYRLEDIPAGRHLVAAGPFRALTYFPGVATPAEAQAIVVTGNSLQEGRDFRLLNRSLVLTVRGTVARSSRGPGAPPIPPGMRLPDQIALSSTLETVMAPIAEDGSFEFQRIPGGTYQALITMPGFTTYPITVVVSPENASRLRFESGTVSGTVVVEPSVPAPRLLQFVRVGPASDSNATLTPLEIGVTSGAFKTLLPSGEYRVTVGALQESYTVETLDAGSAGRRMETVKVDAARALAVTVRIGVSSTPVRVRGRVTGSGELHGLTTVSLGSPLLVGSLLAPVQPDASFEFPAVLPGDYTVTLGSTRVPVHVGNQQIANLELPAPGPPTTNGHFVVEGGGPMPRSVILKHAPAGVTFVPALTETPLIPDASGVFKATITGVNGGRIVLQSTEPSAYSVSSVMFGTDDASTHRATVITGRELVVTFKSTGVKVTGRIAGGASLSADGRKVLLIGTTSVPGTFPTSISREAVVGPDGRFTFSDVFRGAYEIRVAGAQGAPGARLDVVDADVANVSVIAP